ncbi:MAG TPA: hypothetical protein VMR62_25370 [Bryobacteraceae bacterium]|jgi:hypothetical protein|nr:hypothetical protein [Bryobacteraceae bacterium]
MRLIGWEAIRDSTSLNQANGSTPTRWQEATKLRKTAAVLPPWSLPKKVQLRRPTATLRIDLSVALCRLPDYAASAGS